MRRLAVVLIAAALAGCSHRPHANPFDPANGDTGGRPADFFALAGESKVTLRWTGSSSTALEGWHIERAVGDTGAFQGLVDLPAGITSFSDFGLQDGVVHRYRLFFRLSSGLGAAYAEDFGTPGPLMPWIGDAQGAVFALTADGRHVAQRIALDGAIQGVDLERDTGIVWACNFDFGEIDIVSPSGGTVVRVPAQEPREVAVEQGLHTAWIADPVGNVDGLLRHVTEEGGPATPAALPLSHPEDVALSPDGRLWVAEAGGDRVRLLAQDGTPIAQAPVTAPSRVAVDSVTREAWVSSYGSGFVVHVAVNGVAIDTLKGLAGPIGIAVDPRRRTVWVTETDAGAVREYDLDGALLRRVTGFGSPTSIAIDLSTGNAWITDPQAGAVSALSPTGQRLVHTVGIGAPFGLVLDDVRQRAGGIAHR